MPIRLIRFRFHWFFYACLYLFYVAALFLVADLSDLGSVAHTFLRLLLAAFEVAICGAAGRWLLHRWLVSRSFTGWLLYVFLAAVVCLIYVVQVYSIWISNNFISVLAIQNARYSLFTVSPSAIVLIVLGLIWVAVLGFYAWHGTFFPWFRTAAPALAQIKRKGALAIFLAAVILFAALLLQQRRYVSLEPSFIETPIASLMANTWVAMGGHPKSTAHSLAEDSMCFKDPGAGGVFGYPFQKRLAYRDPLPFSRNPGAIATPNVIVFFTEGTSARMIGAYGGNYPGLTPNIDRLAAHSMRVVNYFNHTAATYRGITGQTTSGFTFANGNAWNQGDNGTLLAMVDRQTLAAILNHGGYSTYFFEPEHQGAFTDLLRSLGFSHIYNFDKIKALLHGEVRIQNSTDQIDDSSLFRGLTEFLKQRAASDDSKPFFIGTYNIGTHAFIPMVTGGIKYGDGASPVLNKLHNYDAALGQFLDWFYQSPYVHNTIVIFTSDHATYPDKAYRAVAGAHLKPYFVDKIPLLILDPTHHLPSVFNSHGRNSLDLAPTLLQLLGIQHVPNSFLGHSLFEPRSFPLGIAALGSDFYVTTVNDVFAVPQAPTNLQADAVCERNVVQSYYDNERRNRLFHLPQGWFGPSRQWVTVDNYCSLDSINGRLANSFTGTLEIGKPATMGGWFATNDKHPVGAFAVKLVGGPGFFFPAHQTVARPDVAHSIGGTGPNTYGFNASTNFEGALPGKYVVSFVAPSGETCSTNRHVILKR